MRLCVPLIAVVLMLSGCAAKKHEPAAARGAEVSDSERWRKTDEAVVNSLAQSVRNPRADAGGDITHVVLLWLKTPGDRAAVEKIIRTSHELAAIPGVMNVRVGRPVASTRPVVDATFDVGLTMSFRDEAALHAYETNPQHVKAVNEVLRPLAAKTVVYDIKEADAGGRPLPR
jgi:hypothetical protein